MSPEAALASCRFAHDAAAMLLWGAFGYIAWLVPADLRPEIGQRLATLRIGAVAIAVATALVLLPTETATIGNGWPDAVDPAMLRSVLLDTGIGSAWVVQLAAALLLAVATVLPPRLRTPATATTSGLLLATLSLQGHAAMQEGGAGVLHRLNDVGHVLAGGAWFGALVPLLVAIGLLDHPALGKAAGVALRRFSTAGHAAVVLVIATGILNTGLTLGRWPTDWSSPYQALLGVKATIVALMTGLAILNRYVVVPRMRSRRGSAVSTLRILTLAEVGLALGAIVCVSVFGLLDPS